MILGCKGTIKKLTHATFLNKYELLKKELDEQMIKWEELLARMEKIGG